MKTQFCFLISFSVIGDIRIINFFLLNSGCVCLQYVHTTRVYLIGVLKQAANTNVCKNG